MLVKCVKDRIVQGNAMAADIAVPRVAKSSAAVILIKLDM